MNEFRPRLTIRRGLIDNRLSTTRRRFVAACRSHWLHTAVVLMFTGVVVLAAPAYAPLEAGVTLVVPLRHAVEDRQPVLPPSFGQTPAATKLLAARELAYTANFHNDQ